MKVFIFASTALWRKQILVKAVPISFVAPRNKREKKALENAFYVEIYCVMYNEIQISTKLKIEDMENDSRVYWVNYKYEFFPPDSIMCFEDENLIFW